MAQTCENILHQNNRNLAPKEEKQRQGFDSNVM